MDDPTIYSDCWTEADRARARDLAGPIAVVGASGFIGAKLFIALRKLRQDVFGLARQMESSWRLKAGAEADRRQVTDRWVSIDITDREKVERWVRRVKPRTVFNLSAYGGYERQNVVSRIHEVNYIGTLNLIRAVEEQGCSAFVQAGSSSEYGTNCAAPPETAALRPNSDYAVSKAAASLLVQYYGQNRSFPCANLRFYSVYGPWEDRGRLIPTLVQHALEGTFPPFVDPGISRDFLYVDDCLRALVDAAHTVCRTDPGASINIATGEKTTMEELARVAAAVFGLPGSPRFGTMHNRKWDLKEWYGDPSLAREKMGWQHRISIEEGLRLTAAWEKAAAPITRYGAVPESALKVSAIVACYRDEQAIPIMHQRLTEVFRTRSVDYEIIFVNDGSPGEDETVIRAISEEDPHVIGITHSRNFGSQSAFLSGMEVASGDAVVIMDGDLQDPPEVISEFIQQWEKQKSDIVYGVREKREAAMHMQLFYKLFYRVFRRMADIQIPLDAGDFSLLDRKVVDHLLSLPERDVFLRGLRAWVGFSQTGVPYVRPERMFGKTTNSLMKNIWWAKKAIFSFSIKPLEYIQRLGAAIFLLSCALSLFYLIYYLYRPPVGSKGATTIILLVLGLGGIQLFSTSILGEYIGKILEEVKNRPRFIRSHFVKDGKRIDSPEQIADFMESQRRQAGGKYH